MSTRAAVGIIESDGRGLAAYVHSGAPTDAGAVLLAAYKRPWRVRELVELGATSWIGPSLDPHPDRGGEPLAAAYAAAAAATRAGNMDAHEAIFGRTFAYHRDRREPWAEHRPLDTEGGLDGLERAACEAWTWIEYVYAYTPDGWTAAPVEWPAGADVARPGPRVSLASLAAGGQS